MHSDCHYLLIGVKVKSLFKVFLGLMAMTVVACHTGGDVNSSRAAQLSMEGEQLRSQGNLQASLEKQQEALKYIDLNSDPGSAGVIFNNLGLSYYNLGNYSEALKAFEKAVELYQKVNSPTALLEKGKTLDNMGSVYHQLNQLQKALEMHQAALKVFEQVENPVAAGITLNNIAVLHREVKDYPKALDTYEKALSISRVTNDLGNQSAVLNNMGVIYSTLKEPSKALDAYQKSLEVSRAAKNPLGEANALLNLAEQYQSIPEERSKALEMAQRALSILEKAGARQEQVLALVTISQIYKLDGQNDRAITGYRLAIDITESIRQELRRSDRQQEISYTERMSGLYTQLAELLNQSGKSREAEVVLSLLKQQ
jgi:tetratricopeptide (TPR) repeat protein